MGFWSRLKGEAIEENDEPFEDGMVFSEDDSTRYIRAATANFFIGNESHLLYSADDRPPQIYPSYVTEILGHCRGFKTLDEHLQSCCDAMNLDVEVATDEHISTIKQAMTHLVNAGLLRPESELLETCSHRTGQTLKPPPPIATVAVVTANRIDELERCLTSFMENAQAFGRTNDFVVMDDSQSPEVRDATRHLLRELKTTFNFPITYAGFEEKRRYAEVLIAESGIAPEVINFALFSDGLPGFSGGKNRNALLLHTAGDMFYSSDDDATCRLALPPEDEALNPAEPTEMKWWFFADRQEALDWAQFVEEDLLGIHEQLLGKELCECLKSVDDIEVLNFDQLDAVSLRGIRDGKARVLATFTGLIGDSGAPIPAAYRALGESSLERLLQSHTDYYLASKSRVVFRSVSRPRVGRLTNYNTTALALDNRDLLPPFIPIARGEDYLFGHTLTYSFDGALVGDLPWAIHHAPSEVRVFRPDTAREAVSAVQLAGLVWACISNRSFWPGVKTGAERMRAIGNYLMELGDLPLEEFEELVRSRLWQIQSAQITALDDRLNSHGAPPDYWVEDIQKQVEALRAAMSDRDSVVPMDLRLEMDLEEARRLSQQLVRKFGELLDAWPQMVATAKKLRAHGQRLAISI